MRMNHILDGLPGVQCRIDDILIFGKNQVQHDARLFSTRNRLQTLGITLNSEKCEFSKKSIKFLGHLIDAEGVRADPSKTSAINQLPAPQSLTELRMFMGMVNQLGKFSSKIEDIGQPLCELMSKKKSLDMRTCTRRSLLATKGGTHQTYSTYLVQPKI